MKSKDKFNYVTKPFVKWAGGKRQLIKVIEPLLPSSYETYIEPFVGGGALLFHLKPPKAIINDINEELINAYNTIKVDFSNLLKILDQYQLNHSKLFYDKLRDEIPSTILEKSARFLYLNKSCYNGLYRVNSSGKFNVPFNKSSRVNIYVEENIKNINKYLLQNKVKIFNEDFLSILNKAKKNDFIFCDPPYDTDTNQFTSYNEKSFGKQDQLNLANKLKELDRKNVKWMLTNHNTDYIRELYHNFNIKTISVNRSINSKGAKRKNGSQEVIITNYLVGIL